MHCRFIIQAEFRDTQNILNALDTEVLPPDELFHHLLCKFNMIMPLVRLIKIWGSGREGSHPQAYGGKVSAHLQVWEIQTLLNIYLLTTAVGTNGNFDDKTTKLEKALRPLNKANFLEDPESLHPFPAQTPLIVHSCWSDANLQISWAGWLINKHGRSMKTTLP